jgi:Na+/pantothenate symporter
MCEENCIIKKLLFVTMALFLSLTPPQLQIILSLLSLPTFTLFCFTQLLTMQYANKQLNNTIQSVCITESMSYMWTGRLTNYISSIMLLN